MIELPGFEPIFENHIYSRKQGENIDVIILRRYKEPFQDEIVEHLLKRASEFRSFGIEPTDKLEQFFSMMPDEMLDDVVQGDPRFLEAIRSCLPDDYTKRGPVNLVNFRQGLVPIDDNEVGITEDDSWYDFFMNKHSLEKDGYGEIVSGEIVYDENGLPKKSEVDVLVKHGVNRSITLSTAGYNYSPEDLKKLFKVMYRGLQSYEDILELKDTSQIVIDSLTTSALERLCRPEGVVIIGMPSENISGFVPPASGKTVH